MDVQYEKVCALLTDTIMLMCKNGVQFRNELKVQGLIGLTVDKHVFIIQINEIVKAEEQLQKRQKIAVDTSLGVNFPNNDSTEENDIVIKSCTSLYNRKGKSQRTQHDLSQCLKEPSEASKRVDTNIIKESMDVATYPVSFQNLSNQHSQANFDEVDLFSNACAVAGIGPSFDDGDEQNSPIDLHVGSRLMVSEGDQSGNEPPDIKPLAGDLEEWIVNNTVSFDNGAKGRSPCMRSHETKRSEVLNLKTSCSFDANTSCNSFQLGPIRYNEKKRPVCDDYDYEECEVSKFSCNLCPAAYKHYCNLLTHEVKVHGRQKKKGGRRKKLV